MTGYAAQMAADTQFVGTPATMTAQQVRDGLRHRWPDSEYLSILEAPQSSDRQGRRLDMLVVSLWRSRGHERDGVEIKVSVSDWRRELKEAAKADWWWDHVHRFWVAVPDQIAPKVKPDLPDGWGLLAVNETGSRVVVKAAKHTPKDFTWQTCIGLMRGAADAGVNALERARHAGYDEGARRTRAELERSSVDGRLKAQVDELRGVIAEFEEAAGIRMSQFGGKHIGEVVRLVLDWNTSPETVARQLTAARRDATRAAESLQKLADAVTELTGDRQ